MTQDDGYAEYLDAVRRMGGRDKLKSALAEMARGGLTFPHLSEATNPTSAFGSPVQLAPTPAKSASGSQRAPAGPDYVALSRATLSAIKVCVPPYTHTHLQCIN
jgi:hypothetical protein